MISCLRCGTTNQHGREFCLDCGIRLPRRPIGRWRQSASSANPIWWALALLVVGAIGALAALVAASRDGEARTVVATNLPARTSVRTPPVIGTVAATLPTTAPAVVTPTVVLPSATQPKVTTLTEWTARDGYTVVLASVPSVNGRASAKELAKRALASGVAHVGVLDSRGFSSLQPGYFVVFAGYYRSNAAASAHLSQVEAAGFGPAYARRITR